MGKIVGLVKQDSTHVAVSVDVYGEDGAKFGLYADGISLIPEQSGTFNGVVYTWNTYNEMRSSTMVFEVPEKAGTVTAIGYESGTGHSYIQGAEVNRMTLQWTKPSFNWGIVILGAAVALLLDSMRSRGR